MCSANILVNKAAYLPFGDGAGDHRPLIVDIDEVSVFGAAGVPSGKLKARRQKLNDPRIITKYSSLLHNFYVKDTLYLKLRHLKKIPVSYPIQKEVAKKYEEIYLIQVQGMQHTEKQCCKLHGGKIPWSPEIT